MGKKVCIFPDYVIINCGYSDKFENEENIKIINEGIGYDSEDFEEDEDKYDFSPKKLCIMHRDYDNYDDKSKYEKYDLTSDVSDIKQFEKVFKMANIEAHTINGIVFKICGLEEAFVCAEAMMGAKHCYGFGSTSLYKMEYHSVGKTSILVMSYNTEAG